MTLPSLHRLHIWLAWLVGVPLLLWTVSGLWMVARPLDEVRGANLKAEPPALTLSTPPVFPALPTDHGDPQSVRLEQQWDGPVWIAVFDHGHEMRAAAADGRWLPKVAEGDARRIANRWHKPDVAIVSAQHYPANAPPLDLRRERPSWGITFADGARVYIDADTASLLAIRSNQWRVFDFMWGLHIMDLETRENSSHPILIVFAAIAAFSVLVGLLMLPKTLRRRKQRNRLREQRPPHPR